LNKPLLTIGKIIGPHGIQGEARVISYAESIACFAPGVSLVLKRSDGKQGEYTIASSRPHQKSVLLKLNGIDAIDDVNVWRNSEILLEKKNLQELDDGTYYWFQIIGLKVSTVDHKFLGKIVDIMRTGSNDVYVVSNESKEVLIPAIKSVIVEIDLNKQVMRVDLPEGLL
jgi:16S rRNA processing protein RimM